MSGWELPTRIPLKGSKLSWNEAIWGSVWSLLYSSPFLPLSVPDTAARPPPSRAAARVCSVPLPLAALHSIFLALSLCLMAGWGGEDVRMGYRWWGVVSWRLYVGPHKEERRLLLPFLLVQYRTISQPNGRSCVGGTELIIIIQFNDSQKKKNPSVQTKTLEDAQSKTRRARKRYHIPITPTQFLKENKKWSWGRWKGQENQWRNYQ